MKNHAYFCLTHVDGSLSVMIYILNDGRGIDRTVTEEGIWAECRAGKSFNDNPVVSWRQILHEDIPTNRDYRAAWKDDGQSIIHDMQKAKIIYQDNVRYSRAILLSQLDMAYQRADEDQDPDAKSAVIAEKRRLRDAPADPRIDQCVTIEELRSLDVLSKRKK